MVYGRDNMAAPLRVLNSVILEVADGSFRPDSTKSGMLVKKSPLIQVPLGGDGAEADLQKAEDLATATEKNAADVDLEDGDESAVESRIWLPQAKRAKMSLNRNTLLQRVQSKQLLAGGIQWLA